MAATKSPVIRLLHIRDEIDGIASALQGVSFAAYQGDYTLRRAAERLVVLEAGSIVAINYKATDVTTKTYRMIAGLELISEAER
jgi:hypothetical protein